jgi:DNA polymerase III epsilon subunit-like protein
MLVQLEDGVSIDPGAQKVHGISAEDCSKFGVPRRVALDVFNSALQRADLLVAHNLAFDELVMHAVACREEHHDANNVQQVGGERPGLQRVCTMRSSTDVLKLPARFGKYKWPSLPEAFAHFTDGQDMENGHDAMVDAEACLAVFRGLVESGSLTLEPVLERAEITLDPDHGQSKVLIETDENVEKALLETHDENTEKAPLDISLFPLAKQGELLVTPNDIGFDVGGDTYKHREALKAFGGLWNPQSKCWLFQGREYLATVNRFAGYEMHKQ